MVGTATTGVNVTTKGLRDTMGSEVMLRGQELQALVC